MNVIPANWDKIQKDIEGKVSEGMSQFAERIEAVWRDKANQTLHTSKEKYLKGLSVEAGSSSVTATISGDLPVAIEEGRANYDMKPGLLGNAIFKIIPLGSNKALGIPPKGYATVSVSSPPGSWTQDIQARNIGKQVKEEIPQITEEVFGPLLDKLK